MNIKILGTGGAFDVEEGNSSFIINMYNKNYLVDCGWDVFPKLIQRGLTDKIDGICITHCHDDHVGSLSAYLYYLHFILKKKVPIITHVNVFVSLGIILTSMGMNFENNFHVEYIDEHSSFQNISSFKTDYLHDIKMPSCGFVFDDKLVISGDIGSPIPNLEKYIQEDKIIFHEASTFDSPVHCHYEKLKRFEHSKIYTYHHNKDAAKIIRVNGFHSLSEIDEISF